MKIPKNAKRVFKGVIYDVYQWQQKMFDGSYVAYEALKRPDIVSVISTKNDKIYIADQRQPLKGHYYGLFGGNREYNETPLEGAKRELSEESGMSSHDWELIKTYEPGYRLHCKIYIFIARNCRETSRQKLDPGENIKIKKINFEQFMKIVDSSKFRGKEFANNLFRIKQNKKELAKFKKKIFGQK